MGVHDGDSITVLTPGNVQLKVRLEGIDAPELGQPHGKNAKAALSALVSGKVATVKPTGKDRYGRTLARVFVDAADVNLALVRQGWAWHFLTYSRDVALDHAEQEARKEKIGIWENQNPVAPWDWRKSERERHARERALPSQ